jgi:hypothetical protein
MNYQITEIVADPVQAPAQETMTLAELAMVGGGDSTAFNLY